MGTCSGLLESHVGAGKGAVLRLRTGAPARRWCCSTRTCAPRTSWHRVAPLLVADGHAVVCPDLRGYGQSSKPPTTADHGPYSKRTTAGDVLALTRELGYDRSPSSHDRGAYVAPRLAVDAPGVVSHLAVLDSAPIGVALARADARFAQSWWHWFFRAQPGKPERAILGPDAWYGGDPDRMTG